MSLILNIDTATADASICLARDSEVLMAMQNDDQKEHAKWLQQAILMLLSDTGLKLQDIEAVAVTAGPGSYTGLRVGMATAKGLCYALGLPLITESTLRVMACAAIQQLSFKPVTEDPSLFCAMIDARRMEVFTAMYNTELEEVEPAMALMIDENAFSKLLKSHRIVFFGDGSHKWKHLCNHPNAGFIDSVKPSSNSLAMLAASHFQHKRFNDIAYAEPVYIKEFYSYTKN